MVEQLAHLQGLERSKFVSHMFAGISSRYDLLNALMTAGRHHSWRRRAVRRAVGVQSGLALDVATGTGDFAVELGRERGVSGVIGLDFTPAMLVIASRKATNNGMKDVTTNVACDAHTLPFADNSFMCATVGFGLRNFINVRQALAEMIRVVNPGGRIVILEIVKMEGKSLFKTLFRLYFRFVTPLIGALFAGNRNAYTYLPESVQVFLTAAEIASVMRECGLSEVEYESLAMGSVAIHVGLKM